MQDRISIWACCLVCQQFVSLSWQSVAVMTRECHVLTSFAMSVTIVKCHPRSRLGLLSCFIVPDRISARTNARLGVRFVVDVLSLYASICALFWQVNLNSWNKGNKNALASINVLLIPTCLTGYNVEDMGNCPKRCELPLLTSQSQFANSSHLVNDWSIGRVTLELPHLPPTRTWCVWSPCRVGPPLVIQ
jgi:hypothetical protein